MASDNRSERHHDKLDKLSKALSAVLRHTGQRDGLYITRGGFARLWDIFSLQLLRMKSVSEHDVYEVAYTSYHKDMCPRFEIVTGPDQQDWIRSKRRHSIAHIRASLPAEISWQDVEHAKAARQRLAEQPRQNLDRMYTQWRDEPEQEVHGGARRQAPEAASFVSQQVGRAKNDFNGWEFSGDAGDDDQYLTLQQGEYVIHLGPEEDGWCWGRTLMGAEGWFPQVYFEAAQTFLPEEEESAAASSTGPCWEDFSQAPAPATSSSAEPASTEPADAEHPQQTSYASQADAQPASREHQAAPEEFSMATPREPEPSESNGPLFEANWPTPRGPPTSYGPSAPAPPSSADRPAAFKPPPPLPPSPGPARAAERKAPPPRPPLDGPDAFDSQPPGRKAPPPLPPACEPKAQPAERKAPPPLLPAPTRKAPPPVLPKPAPQPSAAHLRAQPPKTEPDFASLGSPGQPQPRGHKVHIPERCRDANRGASLSSDDPYCGPPVPEISKDGPSLTAFGGNSASSGDAEATSLIGHRSSEPEQPLSRHPHEPWAVGSEVPSCGSSSLPSQACPTSLGSTSSASHSVPLQTQTLAPRRSTNPSFEGCTWHHHHGPEADVNRQGMVAKPRSSPLVSDVRPGVQHQRRIADGGPRPSVAPQQGETSDRGLRTASEARPTEPSIVEEEDIASRPVEQASFSGITNQSSDHAGNMDRAQEDIMRDTHDGAAEVDQGSQAEVGANEEVGSRRSGGDGSSSAEAGPQQPAVPTVQEDASSVMQASHLGDRSPAAQDDGSVQAAAAQNQTCNLDRADLANEDPGCNDGDGSLLNGVAGQESPGVVAAEDVAAGMEGQDGAERDAGVPDLVSHSEQSEAAAVPRSGHEERREKAEQDYIPTQANGVRRMSGPEVQPMDTDRLRAALTQIFRETNGPMIFERDEPRRVEDRVKVLPLASIKYTHDRIARKFCHGPHQGQPIEKLVMDIVEGRVDPMREPRLCIKVVSFAGKLWSLNNRRLHALKTADVSHVRARVYDLDPITAKFLLAYSTTSDGDDVQVGGHTQGSRAAGHVREQERWDAHMMDTDPREAPSVAEIGVQTSNEHETGNLAMNLELEMNELVPSISSESLGGEVECGVPKRPRLSVRANEPFPEELSELKEHHGRVVKCRHPGTPVSREGEDAYYEFRRSVLKLRDRPMQRMLDHLQEKETVINFLLQLASSREFQRARVREVLDELIACEDWYRALSSNQDHWQRYEQLERSSRRTNSRQLAAAEYGARDGRTSGRELCAVSMAERLQQVPQWPLERAELEQNGEETWKRVKKLVRPILGGAASSSSSHQPQRPAECFDLEHTLKDFLKFAAKFGILRRIYKREIAEVLAPISDSALYKDVREKLDSQTREDLKRLLEQGNSRSDF